MSWCRSVLGPNCPDTSAPLSRHFGTGAEVSWYRSVLGPKCPVIPVIYSVGLLIAAVTGQLADTPTRGLDDSRIYWTSRGLDNSRMPRATAARRFVLLAASARPRVVQSATCPVREMSSPRVGNPRVGVSASCPLSSYHSS